MTRERVCLKLRNWEGNKNGSDKLSGRLRSRSLFALRVGSGAAGNGLPMYSCGNASDEGLSRDDSIGGNRIGKNREKILQRDRKIEARNVPLVLRKNETYIQLGEDV